MNPVPFPGIWKSDAHGCEVPGDFEAHDAVQAAPDKDGAQGRGRVSAEVEQQLVPMWLGQGPGAVRAGEGLEAGSTAGPLPAAAMAEISRLLGG
jgi:hypothetical protein